MAERLTSLFAGAYPEISFVTHEGVDPERYFATYSIGLFFDDEEGVRQPCDFRHVGLHRTAGYILGVDPTETPPRLAIEDAGEGADTRPLPEPYVVIATRSMTQAKYRKNPNGWREVVPFLKKAGYSVDCIDQKPVHGTATVWNHSPHGVKDETGDRPLQERALVAPCRFLCRAVERTGVPRRGGGQPSDRRLPLGYATKDRATARDCAVKHHLFC
jgi:autotransporter strand-loop-strand O-heptosyltransferase